MITRKVFLKKTSLSALAGISIPYLTRANRLIKEVPYTGAKAPMVPMVIATWKNLAATEAAMKSLLSGGSPLDAVEAGARVPEADPDETSVGYGGLPDRD